jgi:ADP-heptose:LPS heptosyltransferase
MDRIGVIRLSSLGDIVLSEPVSSNLKDCFPKSEIVFFTRKIYKPIVELFDSVDRIESLDIPGAEEKIGALKNKMRNIHDNYDLIVDIHKNIRSRVILKNLRSTRKLIYNKDRLNRQLAVWFKRKTKWKHTVDKYLEPLKDIGLTIGRRIPKLTIAPETISESQDYLSQKEFEKNKFVVLAVGASFTPKQYPLEQFTQLAKMIDSEYKLKLLVVDEKEHSDFNMFDRLESSGCLGYGIGMDFQMLAAVLSMARMTVSNDSGVMHLSAATGTPTVGLFGPTHPVLGFYPAGEKSIVIKTEERCSPCSLHGKKPCTKDRQYCFTNLTPELIVEKVNQYLR